LLISCSGLLDCSIPALLLGLFFEASLIHGVSSEKGSDIVWKQLEEQIEEENGAADSNRQQVLLPGLAGGV